MCVGAVRIVGRGGCRPRANRVLGLAAAQFIVVSPQMVYVAGHIALATVEPQHLYARAPTAPAAPAAACGERFLHLLRDSETYECVLREAVTGWPGDLVCPRACSESLGLTAEPCDWLAGYVARHGCLLGLLRLEIDWEPGKAECVPRHCAHQTSIYARGVRRVYCRYEFGQTGTGAEVRRAAEAPSSDCILCRARLRYFAKVMRSSPPALRALLASKPRGRLLPWAAVAVSDVLKLRSPSSLCAPLPCPEEASGAWVAFALESPHWWTRAAACTFFVGSACDVRPCAADGMLYSSAGADCDARFPIARALASYSQRNLGVCVVRREHAHGSTIRQVCLSSSGTRLRPLRHLCDARRSRCWEAILADPAGSSEPEAEGLAALDLADRAHCREAQREGCSLPASVGPARNAVGKVVGQVRS